MIIPDGSYSWTKFDDALITIGKYTAIAKNCIFHGIDNHESIWNRKAVANNLSNKRYSKGKILIKNDVWIGEGVRILSGVTIENGAIVGAGTVVTKNVPSYCIFTGNPGDIKKYRFSYEKIKRLLKIKWWEWEKIKIRRAYHSGHFNNIEIFLSLYD